MGNSLILLIVKPLYSFEINSVLNKLSLAAPVLCDGTPKLNFKFKKVNNLFLFSIFYHQSLVNIV